MKKILFILLTILLFSCENAVQEKIYIDPEIVEPEPEVITIESIIYENVFKISGIFGNITTPLELFEPVLIFDDTEYNIETMAPDVNGLPVKTSYTETERVISVQITVDNFSGFYFINNNMIEIKSIDPNNMSSEEFQEMLTFIYAPPEPEIPYYSETKYYLSGYNVGLSDWLAVSEDSIMIGGIVNYYDNLNKVYMNDVRKIMIDMNVDNSDNFLFVNDNMKGFIGIDITDMSYSELVIVADILNRYPKIEGNDSTNTIWELQALYNP